MLRHIILSQGRSGSNFIRNSINIHPEIVNYGEVLGTWTAPSKIWHLVKLLGCNQDDYFDLLFKNRFLFFSAQMWSSVAHLNKKKKINYKTFKTVKSLGVKEFCFHIKKYNLENYIITNTDIGIIYLYRQNLLKRYLSMQNLKKNNVVSTEQNDIKIQKIHIDTEDMIEKLQVLENEAEYEKELLNKIKKNPILSIKYEDAFATYESLQRMMHDVFNFLGVKPIDVVSDHKKILPTSIFDIVDNCDEVIEKLKSTKYHEYIY